MTEAADRPWSLTITPEELARNVQHSLGYPQFQSGGCAGAVVICASGPSLWKTLPLVIALHRAGVPICAIKGTADLLLKHGVVPTYVVSMDGKANQARFFEKPHLDAEYLIAGQSHPDVFAALQGHRVTVWHGEGKEHLPAGTEYIVGGSTTALRSISLMWAKGYTVHHLFGFDCCELDGETHVYEPSKSQKLRTWRMGKTEFRATNQMVLQYQEFMGAFARDRKIQLFVHGNGMLAEAWNRVNDPARADETLDVTPAYPESMTFPAGPLSLAAALILTTPPAP